MITEGHCLLVGVQLHLVLVRVLGLLADSCSCSRVLAGLDGPELLHPFLAGGRADGGRDYKKLRESIKIKN